MIHLLSDDSSEYYSPSTKLLLVTPPPVNSYQRTGDEYRKFEVTRKYAEAVCRISGEENVPVLDVWTSFWAAADGDEHALERFLSDGLHLNAEGYKVIDPPWLRFAVPISSRSSSMTIW